MGDFDPVWDEIYENGRQLNKYPYTSIVSFLMSKIDLHNIGGQPKVIEIGVAPATIYGLLHGRVLMSPELMLA